MFIARVTFRLFHVSLAIWALQILAATPADEASPNFSGKWTLVVNRSQLSEPFRGVTAGTVHIVHQEPSFTLRRVFTDSGNVSTTSFSLSTDGKEVQGREDGMATRQTLSWAGSDLVFVTVYQAPRGEARNTVRYSLEDGGKTLRARESFKGPRVSYDNVWVFSRAE